MNNTISTLLVADINKTIQKKHIVKNVSLELKSGQIIGLLGPNGAGKTTLFYIIVGLIASDSGHIFINDTDVIHYPIHKIAQLGLGYLPQESSIFRKMTVRDNILSILELHYPAEEREARLQELLEELNILPIEKSLGLSLSGGERRRVEIARVLATKPSFILLDEPFAGVDPLSISDIQNIILYLKAQNIGILITDHNVRETLKICDYTYIINEGEVLAEGTAEDLITNKEVQQVYLGQDFSL